ncbi:lipase 3-like [Toxorhynchites rutilus septentrionalis]|uniref:lipase 3-like n=1 Tax=Toxorhynchites rutilus septentrionalis TaxID=329112 RepID=UPI00247A05B0|nr:lipase 3-like [Toxorhynchites rutilus septentrionalis]
MKSLLITFLIVGFRLVQAFPYTTPRGTKELIIRDGYIAEEHETATADGYLLTMFRIPGSPANPPREGKSVVFLQHGLLCSSADWVVLGPGRALAYLLVDAGYDVWLGNARGNTNSRKHLIHSPSSAKFWDFSWHEIGLYDLPAMIEYTLQKTGESSIHYAGHSQGTTAFFVMASLRPEYNAKIRSMHALAPVAFMGNLVSPFIRAIAPFINQVDWITSMLGIHEFMPSNQMMVLGGQKACRDESPFQEVCANVLFLISGFNSPQLNRTIIPAILTNTPAGASVNQIVHYGQGINSRRFRQFDYGLALNLIRYGSITPPNYPLDRVTAPVFLHYGDNDWLAAVRDVQQLSTQLGNTVGLFRVPDNRWNHLDFTYATDAKPLLYDRIIDFIGRWNQ